MLTYTVHVGQGRIKVYATIFTIEGIASVAVEGVLVVEPADVFRLGISAREDAEHQGLVF